MMKTGLVLLGGLTAAIAMAGNSFSQPQKAAESDGIQTLLSIASQSQCAAHEWAARGTAPKSYIEGVTLVFARAVCQPQRSDVQVVSAPVDTSPGSDDALKIYQKAFQANGMRNDTAGRDTLRH